ncbi:MAG TPA: PA14 domain-containing protein, partial [Candidatus Limnocylindrales bacterium]
HGGEGADVIFGGLGDDRLFGGPGRDLIVGNTIMEPDDFEFTSRAGVSDRNDLLTLAANLPPIRAGSTVSGLNIDLDDNGDWYIISAAEAMRRFGDATATSALLTRDMIEVREVVVSEGEFVPTGNHLQAFLFAAENIADPGQPLQLVPRERFSGVPEFYLLHVTDELVPSDDNAGTAIRFDGVDDQIEIGADASLDILRQLTVEFWFRAEVPQGAGGTLDFGVGKDWMPLVYKGNDATRAVADRTYSVWLNRTGFIHFTSANGVFQDGVVNTPAGSIKANEWYHFAGIMDRDTGQMRAYLNGQLVASSFVGTSGADSNETGALHLGDSPERSIQPAFRSFKGMMDEVRVWNVARTEDEVQEARERILEGDEEGLVGYWRFEELAGGAPVTDLSPAGNDGTILLNPDLVSGSGDNTNQFNLARVDGRALILPFGDGRFGSGRYEIVFHEPLGETLHLPGSEAAQAFSAVELGGQPVLIPLGDINNDGFDDAVVSVRDLARDVNDDLRNFARVAFGTAGGLDPDATALPVVLELPAPVFSTDPNNRSVISAAGDVDNDGFDDIAIAVTTPVFADLDGDGQQDDFLTTQSRVYIIFGKPLEEWATGNVAADQGLTGEYFFLAGFGSVFTFPNYDLLAPDLTRTDAQVNFENTLGSFPGVADADVFAARWTGQIRIDEPGTHTFTLASDDGSRLFINDQLVIDHGGLHGFTEKTGIFNFAQPGFYNIRVEMFENFGAAGVKLFWQKPSALVREVVPSEVLFRDARDVINVDTDSDVRLSGFSGAVTAARGGDITPVVGTGILGEYFQIAGAEPLTQVPDLAGLAPAHTRIEPLVSFFDFGAGQDFAGFPDLQDRFAARWTGQIFVDLEETGDVTFGFAVDDGARLFIDNVLVAEVTGINADGQAFATIELDPGFHDLRFEYYENEGNAFVALGWDLEGSNDFNELVLIPAEAFVRADATADNATLRAASDLLVADAGGVRIVHGRARGDWTDLDADAIPSFVVGGASVAALGDVDCDGRDDFAVMAAGELRVYRGGGLPGAPELISIIDGFPGSDMRVSAAGDVDGDAALDILVTGSSFLIFGGDLGQDEETAGIETVDIGDLVDAGEALALPGSAWRAIGDFDGDRDIDDDGDGDRFDDLALAMLTTTDRLNESAQLEHQVVSVFLGAPRAVLAERFTAPTPVADVVIEPGRARFGAPGTLALDTTFFGAAGERTGVDGVTRTLLAVSGLGDGLRIYDGVKLQPAEGEAAPVLLVAPEPYEFKLADPTAPGFLIPPPPGVDLANDANPRARDSFALEGAVEDGRLGRNFALADFNGDTLPELLVHGEAGTYVLFGPVELDDRFPVEEEADLFIESEVGRPAGRMGDITGDGLADLVFVRQTTASGFAVTIIAGGN